MIEPLVRTLTLAKLLYGEGLKQSAIKSAINRMIAVHHFHGAVEIVLRMIMIRYEIRPEKEMNITFESVLVDLDKAQKLKDLGKEVPHKHQLRIINTNRNMIQHNGQEVAEPTLDHAMFYSRAFLVASFRSYFDLDFDSFSPIDLIKDPGIRGLVQVARVRLDQGHFVESCAIQKYAFHHLLDGLESSIPKRSDRHYQLQNLDFESPTIRQLERVFKEVDRGISESFKYSTLLLIGVPFPDYLRFSKLDAGLSFSVSGNAFITHGSSIDIEDARWALPFVTDSILKLEAVGAKSTIEEEFLPKIIKGLETEFSQGPDSLDISQWFEE